MPYSLYIYVLRTLGVVDRPTTQAVPPSGAGLSLLGASVLLPLHGLKPKYPKGAA